MKYDYDDKDIDGLLQKIYPEKGEADIDRLVNLLEGVEEILILVCKAQTDDLAEQIKNAEEMRVEGIKHVFNIFKAYLKEKRKNKEA